MGSIDSVESFVKTVLRRDVLEETFNELIHPSYSSPRSRTESNSSASKASTQFFSTNAEQAGTELRALVGHICQVRNHRQLSKLLGALETAVLDGKIDAKQVCDALLGRLCFQNVEYWVRALSSLELLLPLVDYKGVWDVIKFFFDKTHDVPSAVNISRMRQLNALESLVALILDRSSALCPAYLILDDIRKRLSTEDGWPHWRITGLISAFFDSFQPLAQLFSVVVRSQLVPIVGCSSLEAFSWMLDGATAEFALKGNPRYASEAQKTRSMLIRSVLAQPYSRDMVCSMLDLAKAEKKRCVMLENQIVELMVAGMRRSEKESLSSSSLRQFWQNISSQLMYFTLSQYSSFPDMVIALHGQLSASGLSLGRDHLMWVLLQYTSASIKMKPLSDFLPLLRLFELLYTETEPLPFPKVKDPSCARQLAVTCIWVHLATKAYEETGLRWALPMILKVHLDLLETARSANVTSDHWPALLCNTYSADEGVLSKPIGVLLASQGASDIAAPPKPLSVDLLDSLTVHTKRTLIRRIVDIFLMATKVMPVSALRLTSQLPPALVETYARLLAYNEIESHGIEVFISQLLPEVFRRQAWCLLHLLLEMCSYRLHHIQPVYRANLLSFLHWMATLSQANHAQLQLCIESTALKLITSLENGEVQLLLPLLQAKPKVVVSADSEELNKVLVLTLSRAIRVTGSESSSVAWCKDLLNACLSHTQLNWSSATLAYFPSWLAEFCRTNQTLREDKAYLKRFVEEEYLKWKIMSEYDGVVEYFSQQETQQVFVCLIWKILMEDEKIPPLAYKILDKVGSRALSSQLRTLSDFLVYEVANCASETTIKRSIQAVHDLIWRCHIVPLDKFILILALRPFEDNESMVRFYIVQMLLTDFEELRCRMTESVKANSPQHWMQSDCYEKNFQFHEEFPEKFYWVNVAELRESNHNYLPYLGNICLRFLPVLDIVLHRFIELPSNGLASVETILDHVAMLYRLHDRPLTYLYNTLHYYEPNLRGRGALKFKLVQAITVRCGHGCFTNRFRQYLQKRVLGPRAKFAPPRIGYYWTILHRVVEAVDGKESSVIFDWRFHEFPNAAAYTIHVTCIELMALPLPPGTVIMNLLDIVLFGYTRCTMDLIPKWMNAIGLILAALPEIYWGGLDDRIVELIERLPERADVIESMNLFVKREVFTKSLISDTVALVHTVWCHASMSQISQIPTLVSKKLKPIIKRENQMLLLCQLVAPFFQRICRTRYMADITQALYEILEIVDKTQTQLHYMDNIVDLFYHIKCVFTDDSVSARVEHIIHNLRPELQLRLRFVTHLNVLGSK